MRSVKILFLVLTCGLLAAVYACQSANQNNAPPKAEAPAPAGAVAGLPPNAWQIPCDGNQALCTDPKPTATPTQGQYNEMAWTSFIAMNWPAIAGQRGAPDTTKTIGAKGPDGKTLQVVWDTWKDKTEVFQTAAATPSPWNAPMSAPSGCSNAAPGSKVLPHASKVAGSIPKLDANLPISDDVMDEINEAGGGPLVDQNNQYVRYEVRLNQSEFTYIASGAGDSPKGPGNLYYNANNQKAAFPPNQQPTFNDPPFGTEPYVIGGGDFGAGLPKYAQQGAIEIKAAWKVLDPKKDVVDRYYRADAYVINPNGTCQGPITMGLVGLHILRLTPTTGATWYWATFEQVDNVDIADANVKRPDGSPLTPSLNPGPSGTPAPPYPEGYCAPPATGSSGCGPKPTPLPAGSPLPTNPAPINVSRLNPIASDINALNAKYRPMLKGTVWENYQLVAVLNPNTTGTNPPDPNCAILGSSPAVYPNICVMANTTMETYAQTDSCVSCHQHATAIGGTIQNSQIFTFLLGEAQAPSPTPTSSPPASD